jgi:hypothetical protein
MKRRLICGLAVCSALAVSAPALATQDTGSESVPSGAVDVSPLPSIAPSITESRRFAPILPRKTGEGRRVVYSNSLQWVWVVDKNEQVVRSMPVSGRRGVPAPGSYTVTSQSPWSFSLDFEGVNFRWMTRFAKGPDGGNIGFHEIPRKNGKPMQTESQLGSFAGSGCVRMATEDVKFIYRWAKPGTTVVVTR